MIQILGFRGSSKSVFFLFLFMFFNFQISFIIADEVKPNPEKIIPTVKLLVPYDNFGKVLSENAGKLVVLPMDDFEGLLKSKQEEISRPAKKEELPSPVKYRFSKAIIEGRIVDNFAFLNCEFNFEKLTDEWLNINFFRGSAVVSSATLDNSQALLFPDVENSIPRTLQFSDNLGISGAFSQYGQKKNFLSQSLWKDTGFFLMLKEKGPHQLKASIIVPIENHDEKFSLRLNFAETPISFINLCFSNWNPVLEDCSLKDFTLGEVDQNKFESMFTGYLGGRGDFFLSWRKKIRVSAPESVFTPTPQANIASAQAEMSPNKQLEVKKPKTPAQPMVFAKSETLVSLGENVIQARIDFDYGISKAPVSRFEFQIPDDVEIVSISADKSENHEIIKEGKSRKLVVEFSPPREEKASISLVYEAKVDLEPGVCNIPEIIPLGVIRELGCLAIQALTSVEVQPPENSRFEGTRLFRVESGELPDSLKTRCIRPILLAYRHSARPFDLGIRVKRYQDLPLQTVVADSLDVKTVFTTNQTSNSQLLLKIRNNNKQYLTFQLPEKAIFSSAFINGRHVIPVEGKSEGKILVPLPMSKSFGRPEDIVLKVYYKQPIATMTWKGDLGFVAPLVDVPVTHCSWGFFAPDKFCLYNFFGNLTTTKLPRDSFIFRGFLEIYHILYLMALNPEVIFFMVIFILGLGFVLLRDYFVRFFSFLFSIIASIFRFFFMGAAMNLGSLMIIACIVGILAAIAVPNFRKARVQARGKACYANLRVLLGAIEMYNMDNSSMITTSIDDVMKSNNLLRGYLKSPLNRPEPGCAYAIYGDVTQPNGGVYCKLHGTVEGIPEEKKLLSGENYAELQKPKQMRDGIISSGSLASVFGGGKSRGAQPLEDKLVLTQNFYQLDRDLVIADTSTDSVLLSNVTCPVIRFNYVRSELLLASKIIGLFLGLFAGIYFINSCYFGYWPKYFVTLLIIICLAIFDNYFEEIGDFANLGLWLALVGGIIWKLFQIFSSGDSINPWDGGTGPTSAKKQPHSFLDLKDEDQVVLNESDFVETHQKPVIKEPPENHTGTIVTGIIVLCFLFGNATSLFAQNPREIKIMVPYSDITKVLDEKQKFVILPYEDFNYLKVSTVPEAVSQALAPFNLILHSADYYGKEEEKGVRFKSKFKFELLNEGWKAAGFVYDEVVPSEAMLDGKPVSLDLIKGAGDTKYFGLITNSTGTHELEISYFLPFKNKDPFVRKMGVRTFPFSVNNLVVEALSGNCVGSVDPGYLEISEIASKTIFKARVPTSEGIRLEWFSKNSIQRVVEPEPIKMNIPAPATKSVQIEKEESKIFLSESNLISFEEGFAKGLNRYSASISGGGGIASFDFLVPSRVTVMKVEGQNVEDWQAEDEPGKKMRRLKIAFTSRIKGTLDFTVEFEEPFNELSNKEYELPELIPVAADRSFGMLGIGSIKNFNLNVAGTENLKGYNPIDVSEFLKNYKGVQPEKLPLAFKFVKHPNKLDLLISRTKDIEVQTALIDSEESITLVNEDGYLIFRVAFEVRNNSEQFLKINLPSFLGIKAQLWSCEVAGQPVKAGIDSETGFIHIPIIKSPIVQDVPQPFPVEIIFSAKLKEPLKSMTWLPLALPKVHLPVSQLSWVAYLPEGYELMRGNGNVDVAMQRPPLPLLEGGEGKALLSSVMVNSAQQNTAMNQDFSPENRIFGMFGLLPVKFLLPTSNYSTSFSMSQIEPDRPAPFYEGMLITPKKGEGRYFNYLMIVLGGFAGLATLSLLRVRRPWLSIVVLMLLSAILAVALIHKIYQADHSFAKGFLLVFIGGILSLIYSLKPAYKK
ncbi:MAG: hypothetical protein HQM08_09440 [Candidatus Riflebacteria bacterium]|nr:hypothetical protein [Candidatus Riflebacteria bacterium]